MKDTDPSCFTAVTCRDETGSKSAWESKRLGPPYSLHSVNVFQPSEEHEWIHCLTTFEMATGAGAGNLLLGPASCNDDQNLFVQTTH